MFHGIAQFPRLVVYSCLVIPWLAGCAAFYPLDGIPARYVPDDIKMGPPKGKQMIDLSLLTQRWDGIHLVDSGDVLAVYIGGVLGKIDENPQVQIPTNTEFQPAAGVPVTVREDGTISLPMVGAIPVRGLTLRETEDSIRKSYTDHSLGMEFLQPGRERILVSLQRPRQTHVMVIRQDTRGEPMQNSAVGMLNIGTAKRGSGKLVHLPAYRNDVLNALIATDGLPGLDAENAVYIIRRIPGGPAIDPLWGPDCDPESLIRKSKELSQPKIRGQNSNDYVDQGQESRPAGAIYIDGAPRRAMRTTDTSMVSRMNSAPNSTPAVYPDDEWNYRSPISSGRTNQNPFGIARQADQPSMNARTVITDHADPAWNSADERTSPRQARQQTFNRSFAQPDDPDSGSYVDRDNQVQATSAYQGMARDARSAAYRTDQTGDPQPIRNLPADQGIPASPPPVGYSQPNSYGSGVNWMPPSPASQGTDPSMAPRPGHSTPDIQATPGPSHDPNGLPLDDGPDGPMEGEFGSGGVAVVDGRRILRIPIRLVPGERFDIRKEDVILHDGDIVFIESRDSEVFFTGGLLGGGQYTLPRDTELDIQRAISIATSRPGGGATRQLGGVSALNGDVTISPSTAIVIRRLPDGTEIPIKVNIYRARTDLSERINILPGDYLYLQYTPLEAVAAFLDRHLLEGALFGLVGAQLQNKNSN